MRRVTGMGLCVAALLGAVTYGAKQHVMELERRLACLQQEMICQEESSHLLKAEWAHLSAPARIQSLARQHLGFVPVKGSQIISENEMQGFMSRSLPVEAHMRYASVGEGVNPRHAP